jgi:hypothetical protein
MNIDSKVNPQINEFDTQLNQNEKIVDKHYDIVAIYSVADVFLVKFNPNENTNWYVRYGALYIENEDGTETEIAPYLNTEQTHDLKDPDKYRIEETVLRPHHYRIDETTLQLEWL